MIRSLYSKFLLFTVGAMLLSFFLAFLAVNTYYQHYLKVQNDEKNLQIARQISQFIESNESVEPEDYLATAAATGYKLYLVNEAQEGEFFGDPFRLENLSDDVIQDVLAGEDYHGMRDLPNETFVTGFFSDELANSVGVPVTVDNHDYALFLRPNIKLLFNEIHFLLAGLLGGMALISLAFMLYVARKLVKPISQLTTATEKVGSEQFVLDLPVNRGDEIGQLARSFEQMTEQLEAADQMRKQFINDVSHDFQTPLQNIKGYTALLQTDSLNEAEKNRYATIIAGEANRLSGLTKQLLLLTSLDSLTTPIEPKTFSLTEQITTVIRNYRWLMEEKNISFSMELEEVMLAGQAEFTEKIWENLLSNALKYTPDGGSIEVTLSKTDTEISVTIADSGIGISEEHLPHLFDRFYRVDEARHQKIEGTGLGLSIVQQAVSIHGGTIDVSSTAGKGTVFTVHLPNHHPLSL